MRQGYVMLPWLFNIFMEGCMREVKTKVRKIGTTLQMNGEDWSVAACLFLDNSVLLANSEWEFQRVVDQFHSVCSRRKLLVNSGKRKVMVFERKEVEVGNLGKPYRLSVPVDERCERV